MNLSNFDNNRVHFIEWNDELLNTLSRLHPGSRTMFKERNRRWAKKDAEFNTCVDVKSDIEEIPEDVFELPDSTIEQINEDLYFVLVEKTTGESAAKVKSVMEGEGIHAYFKIFWWFVKTSGVAVQDLSRKFMHPKPTTKEDNMMTYLEAWESDIKILETRGGDFIMNFHMKLIALEVMLEKFPQVYEAIERTAPIVVSDDKGEWEYNT